VRFYQLRPYQKGIAEIQVSHKLMPFLVELNNTLHILCTLQCHSKVNGRSACTSFAKNGKVLTALESQLMN
jgi:hypothetical protein